MRKAALCKFKKQPSTANLISFKSLKARACKIMKESKRKCWKKKYVSKLISSTKTKTVWDMKISIRNNSTLSKHIP